ncbi:hypothetical protein [Desulfosporosinus shakirovi]|uniref:hypothetical protein n=1 Tax=Desulfosporosinus shakirovi TaxID=2885154 RepID=UPI001E5DF75B|nr:hypothetical protein [Desulfosporosinus sp. SRJS8]MCB8817364.1 hypothetical protein [Desulfosporosinus sp. SRJS8]
MDIELLESIEKAIFMGSLEHNLKNHELGKMYAKLIQMRNDALDELPRDTLSIEEIREIAFRFGEDILNLRILIREQKGLDISWEIEKLKQLYRQGH